jgi:disulfide bond formation protein DsbB
MPEYAAAATFLFATAFLAVHVCLGALIIHRLVKGSWVPNFLRAAVERYALWDAAGFAGASLVLSLWYSEVVGLPVCALCWFGRTMMYPLAIILPIAAWRKDRDIFRYALPLAAVGALITGYQHLMQVGFVRGSVCSVLKDAGDCAARYVFEYGYITMPLFGVTVFTMIALLTWVARDSGTEHASV